MRTKILLAIATMLILTSGISALATPYAVYCEDDKSFHFLVSSEELTAGATLESNGQSMTITSVWEVGPTDDNGFPLWNPNGNKFPDATTVTFESSFSNFKPINCSYWFSGASKLTNIDELTNLNTSDVTSMQSMFVGCSALTSLDLSSLDTSNVTDMAYMFERCSGLTSLILGSKFNTSKVTNMKGIFQSCSALTSLNLSNFDTSKVENMSVMFNACSALTSLDLSKFNTANVTDMYNMFNNCSALTSLDLSSFDTTNVTDMSNMFNKCSALTSLDLSSFNTTKVTYMSTMFNNCSTLTSLDLSSFDTAKVTNTTCIVNCNNLRTLIFGGSFDDFAVFIQNNFISENALIFVGAQTQNVPEGRANVVVGDQCDHLIINYGTTPDNHQLHWSTPREFTANKVTIGRAFKKDQPYTLYLPFAMDAAYYGTFYTDGEYSNGFVTFSKLSDAQTTADKPYMFIPNADFDEGITISSVDVKNLTGETEADGLQGVADKKIFTADEAAQKIYYGWANGAFCWAMEGATVDACRAYFRLPASAAAKAPAKISVKFGDEDITGVVGIDGEDNDIDSPIYNLNGQRVDEGYKGIVIKSGKKTANFSR